ncbi:MmgE/PrpD family protein [Roseibium sediminicola]|uniref:MmgE/PrpD family protein n=1 Tax=Roseibium sediminicola TaxID=2933272 RepID=A0ABT0H3C3_9HYPH|nr:MmgE/PrpD family protein [Roseibium sp. CAU 1639]MCK7616187.1 MmgE/PrpD family protein [Roseibium sp. CAU 1639]
MMRVLPTPDEGASNRPGNAVASFVLDSTWSDIPASACEAARLWLLDLLGVAASGSTTELSRIARRHAAEHFGAGSRSARMLFDSRPVSPQGAALAGAMTVDAMDGHDGHKLTKGHVGCGVVPALLALAEAEGMTCDREFLTAMVIGYEIGTRAGIALHRTASDYHTSGAWVAVACAALGARVLRADSATFHEAIGIAEYHGPRSQMMRCIDHPTMVKDGSGWGAMAGVSAAYLAADGFTGAPALTVTDASVSDLWDDLGCVWRIHEQYYKAFPVCRWAQPAVQSILDLRERYGISNREVDRVEIVTFHESRRLATVCPRTTEEAQYSTTYPAAIALVRGRVEPEDLVGAALSDPEVLAVAQRMVITESGDFNAAFPARRLARVVLHLVDGTELCSTDTEARGDPETGIASAELRDKFHRYSDPVIGTESARRIEEVVLALGSGQSLGQLLNDVLARP